MWKALLVAFCALYLWRWGTRIVAFLTRPILRHETVCLDDGLRVDLPPLTRMQVLLWGLWAPRYVVFYEPVFFAGGARRPVFFAYARTQVTRQIGVIAAHGYVLVIRSRQGWASRRAISTWLLWSGELAPYEEGAEGGDGRDGRFPTEGGPRE